MRLKVERIKKICPRCGKEFTVGGRSGNLSKIFCSKSCASIGKPGRAFGWKKQELEPTEIATKIDIAWVAGVYEGEGWCSRAKNGQGTGFTTHVGVGQKDEWLLYRLKTLFGGSIYRSAREGKNKDYKSWNIHGSRAREFLERIYPFLSPRRQEKIKAVLVNS